MPFRDHFHPPFQRRCPWARLHSQWPGTIVRQLNEVMPPGYAAAPSVHIGVNAKIDIGGLEQSGEKPACDFPPNTHSGGAATALWAPPMAELETDMADFDEFEVRIYEGDDHERLVAAIELISPANKDRPDHRNQFVTKCASILKQGASLVLVDFVTNRHHFNLYHELLRLIGQESVAQERPPATTYATACRWIPQGMKTPLRIRNVLQVWDHPLTLGNTLPRLPLWLADDLVVPLELETSYEQTLRDLRIRVQSEQAAPAS